MQPNINDKTIVIAARHLIVSYLEEGVVILSPADSTYYALNNGVGALVWNLLQHPIDAATIREYILGRFDVEEQKCQGDIINLLHDLDKHGLIEIVLENRMAD